MTGEKVFVVYEMNDAPGVCGLVCVYVCERECFCIQKLVEDQTLNYITNRPQTTTSKKSASGLHTQQLRNLYTPYTHYSDAIDARNHYRSHQ